MSSPRSLARGGPIEVLCSLRRIIPPGGITTSFNFDKAMLLVHPTLSNPCCLCIASGLWVFAIEHWGWLGVKGCFALAH